MRKKYKRAFEIACELLNGAMIYGVDADSIFAYVLETDGCVCASDYEDFILNNIDRFSDDDKIRNRARIRLGW